MTSLQHIRELIDKARYLEALTKLKEAGQNSSGIEHAQLHALALSKLGMPESALKVLEPVYYDNPDDAETAGILGGIYKELFKKNEDTPHALMSRDTYLKNFNVTKNYYTGINAAAMSAILMQSAKAKQIANQLLKILKPDTNEFWEQVTIAEAYLLIKERQKSAEYYAKAKKNSGGDWGKIDTVYKQLWLLNHYMPVMREILRMYEPPGIVAFTGHMIDYPGRTDHRFPASIEHKIRDAIHASLSPLNAHIGFSSMACGSDILFAETMIERGGELNLFIPFRVDDFIKASVQFPGSNWVDRFHAIINHNKVTILTHEPYGNQDELFMYQSKIIMGSALLRSMRNDNKVTLLTVLSQTDLHRKLGGTNSSLRLWPRPDAHVNINPDLYTASLPPPEKSESSPPAFETITGRRILTLLSIDLSHASALHKDEIKKLIDNHLADATGFLREEKTKDQLIFGHESESEVFDLVAFLYTSAKQILRGPELHLLVHSGLGYNEGSEIKGEVVDVMMAMSKEKSGRILATEEVAALMSLQPKRYRLAYSGILTHDNISRTVYEVTVA